MNAAKKPGKGKALGTKLAHVHSQPLPADSERAVQLNGRRLYVKSRLFNMPFHENIEAALDKMDSITEQASGTAAKALVPLWNGENGAQPAEAPYGNPAWDLGIVINSLKCSAASEEFLRQYLDSGGVLVTVIELYAGIFCAMLDEAMESRNEAAWQLLAENECADIIHDILPQPALLAPELPARLGLPGLRRV